MMLLNNEPQKLFIIPKLFQIFLQIIKASS